MHPIVPFEVWGHEARGPHEPEPGAEGARDRHGQDAVHVQQDHHPRLIQGSEDHLPNGEGGMGEGHHGGLGPHGDADRDILAADIERVVLQAERKLEVVQDLQGVDPGLERSAFVAEDGGSPANHVEKAAGLGGPRELQAAPGQGEAGQGGSFGPFGPGKARRDQDGADEGDEGPAVAHALNLPVPACERPEQGRPPARLGQETLY